MARMKNSVLLSSVVVLMISPAAAQTFASSAGDIRVETVATGLVHPWSLQFLPDGRMLVTERPGRMRTVTADGKLSPPLDGVPQVVARGQSGLLDVALDRDFVRNNTIYFCFTYESGGNAAIAHAVLGDSALSDVKIIFKQQGPGGSNNHGCRIAQEPKPAPDKNLFVTLGDHFGPRDEAQNLGNDNGKLIRIAPDGEIPTDNPFVAKPGARPEIWSYGHRNGQGLTFGPDGKLWEQEHGPQGGDEINIIEKGKNYGWPVIGYGVDYGGAKIHESTHKEGMEQPVWHWTPSIAPSGMAFYSGKLWPAWKGSLFNGALKFQLLARLDIQGGKPVKEERMLEGLRERIRDVREGPDGALYLLTDNERGRILRVMPAK
ncbi:MAG: PQQ-dependent sugar dehydrogenase [Pseudolabrys sp.]|nr:PQQ-dependent sugar dehydrogenase [Pseudolabrys sp.]